MKKHIPFIIIIILLLSFGLFYTGSISHGQNQPEPLPAAQTIEEDGRYYSRDEVALYLHTYNHLPSNYVTKNQARKLGWKSNGNDLWDVCEGCVIGGDTFGNREGLLPEKEGRTWKECDCDYKGGNRNGKRIVFSNDGLIYYTDDHYNSFVLLYGEE